MDTILAARSRLLRVASPKHKNINYFFTCCYYYYYYCCYYGCHDFQNGCCFLAPLSLRLEFLPVQPNNKKAPHRHKMIRQVRRQKNMEEDGGKVGKIAEDITHKNAD